MKKVIVFTTAGQNGTTIESEALNWEQLKKDLSAKGVNYSGMKAVIGQTKVTLENPEAAIPDGDFNLFLFPVKTKSGAYNQKQANALSYGELRAAIKDAFNQNAEGAGAHFNKDKNYTNKSTQDLKDLLATYKYPKASASAKAAPAAKAPVSKAVAKAAPPKANIADTVKSVAKEQTKDKPKTTSLPAKTTSKAVATTVDSLDVDAIVSMIEGLPASQSDKDFAIKAVMKLKVASVTDALDTAALDREARELAKGFSDIKY